MRLMVKSKVLGSSSEGGFSLSVFLFMLSVLSFQEEGMSSKCCTIIKILTGPLHFCPVISILMSYTKHKTDPF